MSDHAKYLLALAALTAAAIASALFIEWLVIG